MYLDNYEYVRSRPMSAQQQVPSSVPPPLTHLAVTASPSTVAATLHLWDVAQDPVQGALAARVLTLLARVIQEVGPAALGDAAGAPSDYDVLLRLLEYPEVAAVLRAGDPQAPSRLRWLRAREDLLQAEGGTIPVGEAAALLHLTRQAVDKRRRAGTLIGLDHGRRGYLYPVWQFTQEGILPGLQDILTTLAEDGLEGWDQLAYMLSGDPRLGGLRPLDALRQGRVDDARAAARLYGEQGGA